MDERLDKGAPRAYGQAYLENDNADTKKYTVCNLVVGKLRGKRMELERSEIPFTRRATRHKSTSTRGTCREGGNSAKCAHGVEAF